MDVFFGMVPTRSTFYGTALPGDYFSDLSVLLIGLEFRYGRLNSLLANDDPSAETLNDIETAIIKLQRLIAKIAAVAANVDRLLPRLLVAIGSEPAGKGCSSFDGFRRELFRLGCQSTISVTDWQRLLRTVPANVKLNIAATADKVARRYPFLLQEYRLQQYATV